MQQRGKIAVTLNTGSVVETRGEILHDFQRIEPERLNLNRLSHARGYYTVTDFSVHPGKLHSGFTGMEQAILQHANVVAGATQVPIDDAGEDGIKLGLH